MQSVCQSLQCGCTLYADSIFFSVSHSLLCIDSGNIYTIHSAVSVTTREGRRDLHSNDAELNVLYCSFRRFMKGIQVLNYDSDDIFLQKSDIVRHFVVFYFLYNKLSYKYQCLATANSPEGKNLHPLHSGLILKTCIKVT